jgi:hypothetical protein
MGWSATRNRFYPTLLEEPERFLEKVDKRAADECWLWTGCCDTAGYGRAGKRERAHRIAYQIAHGPLPDGVLVRHTCDNPPCCNPGHLRLGSFADNTRDMVERGRHYSLFSAAERRRHGFPAGGAACKP